MPRRCERCKLSPAQGRYARFCLPCRQSGRASLRGATGILTDIQRAAVAARIERYSEAAMVQATIPYLRQGWTG